MSKQESIEGKSPLKMQDTFSHITSLLDEDEDDCFCRDSMQQLMM